MNFKAILQPIPKKRKYLVFSANLSSNIHQNEFELNQKEDSDLNTSPPHYFVFQWI